MHLATCKLAKLAVDICRRREKKRERAGEKKNRDRSRWRGGGRKRNTEEDDGTRE